MSKPNSIRQVGKTAARSGELYCITIPPRFAKYGLYTNNLNPHVTVPTALTHRLTSINGFYIRSAAARLVKKTGLWVVCVYVRRDSDYGPWQNSLHVTFQHSLTKEAADDAVIAINKLL